MSSVDVGRPGGRRRGLRRHPRHSRNLDGHSKSPCQPSAGAARRITAAPDRRPQGPRADRLPDRLHRARGAILDEACDLLLVGNSVGMVLHGLPNTVGVTLEMMILHGQAVMRGSHRALVAVDMPFGSYEGAKETAYANAARILKETGARRSSWRAGPPSPKPSPI